MCEEALRDTDDGNEEFNFFKKKNRKEKNENVFSAT
jgi:hypothetical protein